MPVPRRPLLLCPSAGPRPSTDRVPDDAPRPEAWGVLGTACSPSGGEAARGTVSGPEESSLELLGNPEGTSAPACAYLPIRPSLRARGQDDTCFAPRGSSSKGA